MSGTLQEKLQQNEEEVTALLRDMTKLSRQKEYKEIQRKLELLVMRLEFIEIINKA